MTALAGYVSWSRHPDSDRFCADMLAAQRLYGGRGPALWREGGAALGRDAHPSATGAPSAPLIGAGGRLVLAADVRLDNRDDLAGALGLAPPGHDEELLLTALERWGEGAAERLVGEFAFALWDGAQRSLLLARDFLGQRPLYLASSTDGVAFASSPKGLHALPDVARAPNHDAVADYLAFIPDSGSECFFAGMEKVPAGCLMRLTLGGRTARSIWTPARRDLGLRDQAAVHAALRAEMDRATAARLRGHTKVAAQLSGGLDSATVTATAARLLGVDGRVCAYTAVPRPDVLEEGGGRILNEGRLAGLTAAMYPNVEPATVTPFPQMAVDTFDRSVFLYGRPAQNHSNEPWVGAINDAAAARGLTLLLHGSMGNLSFSHSGMELLPALFGRGRWLQLARHLRALRRQRGGWPSMLLDTLGPYVPMPLWRPLARRRSGPLDLTRGSFLRADFAGSIALADRAARLLPDPHARPPRDAFAVRAWALRRVDVGAFTKGILGGWGLQLSDPTADRRLIEFCLSLPARFYMQPGEPRALARRAFADRLPPEVARERRKGLQAADGHEALVAGRDRVVAEAEAIAASPGAGAVIDTKALLALARSIPKKRWEDRNQLLHFQLHGLRALAAGHFIRRAEEPSPQPPM